MNEFKKEIGSCADSIERQRRAETLERIRGELKNLDLNPVQRRIYEGILAVHERIGSLDLPVAFQDPEVARTLMEYYKT